VSKRVDRTKLGTPK